MSLSEDRKFYRMRKEGKLYISRVFSFDAQYTEPVRFVHMVMDDQDEMHFGELDGAMCLRLYGKACKTQVTALISQDDHHIQRLTLQKFHQNPRSVSGFDKHEFTFQKSEFRRLLSFLKKVRFLDYSDAGNFTEPAPELAAKPAPKPDRVVAQRPGFTPQPGEQQLLDKIRTMRPENRRCVLHLIDVLS